MVPTFFVLFPHCMEWPIQMLRIICKKSNSTSHPDDPNNLQKYGEKNAFFATDWPTLLSPAPSPKKEAVHPLCNRRNNPDDPDQLEKNKIVVLSFDIETGID